MRYIDNEYINSSVGMPYVKGMFAHNAQAMKDLAEACLKTVSRSDLNTSTTYILYGCKTSTSGLTTYVSAGALLYYNDTIGIGASWEILLSPTQSFTSPSVGHVITCSLLKSYYTGTGADPVTFSDSSTQNVHVINTAKFQTGTSGSGSICDFGSLVAFPVIGSLDAWTNITIATPGSFATISGHKAQYTFDGQRVTFRGLINNISGGAITLALLCNIPAALQPPGSTTISQLLWEDAGSFGSVLISGTNVQLSMPNTGDTVSLDGISYLIQP